MSYNQSSWPTPVGVQHGHYNSCTLFILRVATECILCRHGLKDVQSKVSSAWKARTPAADADYLTPSSRYTERPYTAGPQVCILPYPCIDTHPSEKHTSLCAINHEHDQCSRIRIHGNLDPGERSLLVPLAIILVRAKCHGTLPQVCLAAQSLF